MEMIIARSGLSTGAVYRYFKGKDEIIEAARQMSGLVDAAAATGLGKPGLMPTQG